MILHELISNLIDRGIELKLDKDNLVIDAPSGLLTPELIHELRENKQGVIDFLKLQACNTEFFNIKIAPSKEFYPLSSAQKRLYLLQQMSLTSTAYNIPFVILLNPDIDLERVNLTFKKLIDRHESFRTSFEVLGEQTIQRIHPKIEFVLEKRMVSLSEETKIRDEFIQPFNLSQAPLLRVLYVEVEGANPYLIVDMHHIISDGVSLVILKKEFMEIFERKELVPLRLQYKDFSEWQNSNEQKERVKEQEKYWLNIFNDELPVLNLPTDFIRPLVQGFEGASVDFILTKEETLNVKKIAREQGLTLYMYILSVFTIFLSKLSRQDDIVVGSPIVGRSHVDLQRIVGMFVNTLAIRNRIEKNNTLKEYLDLVKQTVLEAFENQNYQFEDLVEKVSVNRDISRNPIFDVMFNLLNHTDFSKDLSGVDNSNYNHTIGTSKFDLNLTAVDYGAQLLFNLEYSSNLFTKETIDRFIKYFKSLLNNCSDDVNKKILEIEIIDDQEKKCTLELGKGINVDFDNQIAVNQLFENKTKEQPDAVALIFNNEHLTYQQLNSRANQLAQLLRTKGVKSGTIVAIILDRSFDLIISILAILKGGGAYLPIDMEYPLNRKNYMLKDGKVNLLLIDRKQEELRGIDIDGIEIVDVRDKFIYQGDDRNLKNFNTGQNLIYLIYTSGSTGIPKGVMIKHSNMVNLLMFNYIYTNIDFSIVLQFSTISFDVSAHEIFGTLLFGGKLILGQKENLININDLYLLVSNNSIRTLFLPMSFLRVIFSDFSNVSEFPKCVHHIQTAGEQVVINNYLKTFLRNRRVFLHNHYGPSETHVVTTLTISPDGEILELPSIGRPIMNTEAYILDENSKLLPRGVIGELFFGGAQLGRGYFGKDELTKDKFIVNPYIDGDIIYRTGDLARWMPDGNIEFLGRVDSQLKIRGFRIEPGEIESCLLKYNSIREAAVIGVEGLQKEKYLCAYIVSKEGVNEDELRNYLLQLLPSYMVPSYFIEIEKIPLNPNGKVSRKDLPLPKITAKDDYIPPANELEEKLAEIWSEVLRVDKGAISVNKSFFELGGHSLKLTILLAKLHKEFNVKVSFAEAYRYSSIKELSKLIKISKGNLFNMIPNVEKKEYYPLTKSQKGIGFYQMMYGDSSYNIPMMITIEDNFNVNTIENLLNKLIYRHESFRTSFAIINDNLVQKIHNHIEIKIPVYSIDKSEIEEIASGTLSSFNLSEPPLIRACILKYPDKKPSLIVNLHHIISDEFSIQLLLRELQELMSDFTLKPLRLQFRDFASWQAENKEFLKIYEIHKKYWLSKFNVRPQELNLPIDFPRKSIEDTEGDRIQLLLSEDESTFINEVATFHNSSVFVVILSLYYTWLLKLTDQEDIVIGTPVSGRYHDNLDCITGMFVNTLALRNFPSKEKPFISFFKELHENTYNDFDNQYFGFDELVSNVVRERKIGRNPLFDVYYTFINNKYSRKNKVLAQEEVFRIGVKFDMFLSGYNIDDQILLHIEYKTSLFKKESIEYFSAIFKDILHQIIENKDILLGDIILNSGITQKKLDVFDLVDDF